MARECAVLLMAMLAACSAEKRIVDADQPVTAPARPGDPQAARFEGNAFQISQGGRYFAWYGCGTCHGTGVKGPADLSDPMRRDRLIAIYAKIQSHGTVTARIPVEQRWQLAAFVRQLPATDREYRRRQDLDQVGEPQGSSWQGPVR